MLCKISAAAANIEHEPTLIQCPPKVKKVAQLTDFSLSQDFGTGESGQARSCVEQNQWGLVPAAPVKGGVNQPTNRFEFISRKSRKHRIQPVIILLNYTLHRLSEYPALPRPLR